MRDLGKIVTHIPARAGSKRLKSKNLRYLAGQPLITYAIQAALASEPLQQIYVNTDSKVIAALAKKSGALVYRRKSELASDTATSDQFNMDIIENLKPDTLIMINPVCPLLEPADIDYAVNAYRNDTVDTLITSTATQMQCFCNDQPVNINLNEALAPSQENPHVHICNWTITIWDAHKFRDLYQRQGFAVFGEHRKLLPIDPWKAVKISTEEDFQLAEIFVNAFRERTSTPTKIEYWSQ